MNIQCNVILSTTITRCPLVFYFALFINSFSSPVLKITATFSCRLLPLACCCNKFQSNFYLAKFIYFRCNVLAIMLRNFPHHTITFWFILCTLHFFYENCCLALISSSPFVSFTLLIAMRLSFIVPSITFFFIFFLSKILNYLPD